MGGRSRDPEYRDRWDWVGELSDYRLTKYGEMSYQAMKENSNDVSKTTLNWACAKEYQRRTGSMPDWYKKDY